MRVSWMIGGAQGSGVDSSANFFAYSVASSGYNVYGKREYFSNIKGRHSYFTVVASDGAVRSVTDEVHVLTSFDAETVFRHAFEVMKGGVLIYDKYLEGERLKNQSMLEPPEIERIEQDLDERGVSGTLKDVVRAVEESGVNVIPMPYMDLLKRVGEIIGESQLSALTRMVNTLAVASSFKLLNGELNFLEKGLSYAFRAKKAIVRNNMIACQVAYEYVGAEFGGVRLDVNLRPIPNGNNGRRVLISGTSMVGIAKIASGCRVQSYYPITPAADESFYLEDEMEFGIRPDGEPDLPALTESKFISEKGTIVVFQTEDELAAIDLAIGASLAGIRSATATSGPGFSLMPEGLDWASINEVPVVITIYSRGGPSTGLPTRHEQSDLLFSVFAGHGEAPRIVLASGDIEEAFYDTIKAFNYAERYQMPVIHLLDKSIANSTQSVPFPDLNKVVIDRGLLMGVSNKDYRRFEPTDSGISPRIPLGTKDAVFWNTGDEHDEHGHISEDPVNRVRMMEKRMKKLELADKEIPADEKVSVYGNASAENWIISWGSTKGPILDALELLREEGFEQDIAFLQVKLLWPFPGELIKETLKNAKRVIDLEQNYMGQMALLMRMNAGLEPTNYVLKFNGRPFTMTEVRDAIKTVIRSGVKKLVATRGK
ncbi:MAG: 2-oxoacid:acceptor oxidoreductase subunit alpha [Thaumarchaeota archaeon]|nr:2-oxoacid:acceptor oxidoreductase subunit alpha [Candidatus Calditenuaceae archaeon]MDW8186643.1 2-oxoacid:ferredoxin oxidoreductase subunit alpha [Nitrososphaerota archaeon]